MIYGYARVSTVLQEKDGNSLEAQEKQLYENGALMVYKDSFTGTKKHRPELDKLMSAIQSGDTLMVTKLDRMARSTIGGCELVEKLIAQGIRVYILNMGVLDNTPTSKLMRTMFFAFAEYERDMIVERTNEGKAIKKAKGELKEGRKKIDVPLFKTYYKKFLRGTMTATECIRELGISKAKWYRLVKEG